MMEGSSQLKRGNQTNPPGFIKDLCGKRSGTHRHICGVQDHRKQRERYNLDTSTNDNQKFERTIWVIGSRNAGI